MTNALSQYFAEIIDRAGRAWNRFWFTPNDVLPLCVLRIAVGVIALYYVLSFSTDLTLWFGDGGLLPTESVRLLTGANDAGVPQAKFHISPLFYFDAAGLLWVFHLCAIAVTVACIAGLMTRVSTVLTLVAVLSYAHRAPMITGQLEPVLTMLLFYLCLAPAGTLLSLDALLKKRKAQQSADESTTGENKSVMANLSLRLIQIHLAGFFVMMALSKLGGSEALPWWTGESVWWLIAQTETRLVDLTFLHRWPYVINIWTHSIVLFELAFPLFIWNRLARPLLIGMSLMHWPLLALITGLVPFAFLMMLANLAFVPADQLRSCCDKSTST